jgi:5'-methylthioadenosine phosphorylase
MMEKIGIIGGSGLYNLEGLTNKKEVAVKTPFGQPSDKLMTAKMGKIDVVFLPRHGRHHSINPSLVNYRANIYAMKKLGVGRILSVSACGSLKEELKPMDFVLPDQFLDRTHQARKGTFFEDGIVAHVALAHPICADMAATVYDTVKDLGIRVHKGGIYVNMEGPQFSTKAESHLYRSWGMDIIGMTNMTESRLAREAEICYVSLSAITDYDCWKEEEVTLEMILNNLHNNVENSKKIIKAVIPAIAKPRTCACKDALKYAIVTQKEFIPLKTKKKLSVLTGKYIK